LVRYALILPFHQPFLTEFNINERNLSDYISRLKRGKEKGRACHFMVQAMPAPYDANKGDHQGRPDIHRRYNKRRRRFQLQQVVRRIGE
jgi:hypothetical protein